MCPPYLPWVTSCLNLRDTWGVFRSICWVNKGAVNFEKIAAAESLTFFYYRGMSLIIPRCELCHHEHITIKLNKTFCVPWFVWPFNDCQIHKKVHYQNNAMNIMCYFLWIQTKVICDHAKSSILGWLWHNKYQSYKMRARITTFTISFASLQVQHELQDS